jgi:hypothetical protein
MKRFEFEFEGRHRHAATIRPASFLTATATARAGHVHFATSYNPLTSLVDSLLFFPLILPGPAFDPLILNIYTV